MGLFRDIQKLLKVIVTGKKREIGEISHLVERQHYIATHDEQTGLPNRTFYETELDRLRQGQHYQLGVVIATLEELKHAEDAEWSRQAARLIRTTASMLRNFFDEEMVVARIDYAIFAIILTDADESMVRSAMQWIVEKEPEYNQIHETNIQLSVGGVVYRSGDDEHLENVTMIGAG